MSISLPDIEPIEGFDLYPRSRVTWQGTTYCLAQDCSTLKKYLAVSGEVEGFSDPVLAVSDTFYYPLNPINANQLRQRLPWMRPQPFCLAEDSELQGRRPSFGFGDRLGLASPGHALAAWNAAIYPIFAQQSVRENARTGRTPQQVLDDAMWGIFQTGWGKPWGADADHLKSPNDLPAFVQAGYTFFTIDPGEYVEKQIEDLSLNELKTRVAQLPWTDLQSSPPEIYAAYLGKQVTLENARFEFDETTLLRALAKYGGAIAHSARMYRELEAQAGSQAFDFEISVDETETPTQISEHYFIANELRRLKVRWNSLAPRFPGRFEKGVDFIGDLKELETALAGHAAVMHHFGNYRLSLHSGSDKFSVYELLRRYAGSQVHIKTAGTSYLEALRVIACQAPDFFRKVLDYARRCYPQDRTSYHVSASLEQVPASEQLGDQDLQDVLENFHARQVLHVTYGSVLNAWGETLKTLLKQHEAEYIHRLEAHFRRHLRPFKKGTAK